MWRQNEFAPPAPNVVVNIAHNPRNICRSRDRNLSYSSAAKPNALTNGSYESEMYKIWQQSMTEWVKTETRGMCRRPGSNVRFWRRKADIEQPAGQRIFAPSTKETEHPSRDLTYSDVLRPVSGSSRPSVLLFAVIVFVETVRDLLCDGWRFRPGDWLAVRSH